MAEKGFTGVNTLFEGKAGIFHTYFQGRYDRAAIVDNLGTKFMGDSTLYKPWPVVGVAHTYIHVTIEQMKKHGLVAEDIEQIRAYVGDYHQRMCTPLETRRSPTTAVDAKFSLPFCLAIAATKGDVGITDFAPASLQDAAVLAMAQRIVPVEDSSRNWTSAPPDARVEIVTRDGRQIEGVGSDVPGSSHAPMTWEDILRKFRNCASAGASPLTADRVEHVCRMARDLETLDDATELVRALAPSGASDQRTIE
jgi:2-methylcitrate dehydratase PrpD